MKFSKKILSKCWNLTTYGLLKKGGFCLLFSLETLTFHLWLDSNPGPCASQSDPLFTIPNNLTETFWKKFQGNFKRFLQSFFDRDDSRIEQQSAISFKKTKQELLITFVLDGFFALNFQNFMRKYTIYQLLVEFSMRFFHLKSDVHYYYVCRDCG